MPLLPYDGARSIDGANYAVDIAAQSVTAQVNGAGFDMADFSALLVTGICNAITGSGVGNVLVQESNNNSTFTNVSGGSCSLNTANTCKRIGVDWTGPGRQRYARVSVTNTTNAATLCVTSLRLTPERGPINADGSLTLVASA